MARTVNDIMTTDLEVVGPDTPIREVARMMRDGDVGTVLIGENDRLAGIVTDRDLVIQALADGRPHDAPVQEFMTRNPQTVRPDMTIHKAADIMQSHRIRRLPVCDGDRLVGIVSLGDLAVDTQSPDLQAETLEEVSSPGRA